MRPETGACHARIERGSSFGHDGLTPWYDGVIYRGGDQLSSSSACATPTHPGRVKALAGGTERTPVRSHSPYGRLLHRWIGEPQRLVLHPEQAKIRGAAGEMAVTAGRRQIATVISGEFTR